MLTRSANSIHPYVAWMLRVPVFTTAGTLASMPAMSFRARAHVLIGSVWLGGALAAYGQKPGGLPAAMAAKTDEIARATLAATGVPSASVAIVKDGRIAYLRAYGKAQLEPAREAETAMRYAVGSISKQFTAAAILLLAEEGKLGLDDPVARFFPELTRSNEVTIRMLLSHTSGYSDYWPQDYVMKEMLAPVTARQVVQKWAGPGKALDFAPGTKWEYSNTNYVIAGQIVEKITGRPLSELLRERIFKPLGMSGVFDVDQAPLPASDAIGYYRHALGPLRPAPKTGTGWLSAAGELSMPAQDLARWQISLINRSLLKPASYDEMFREVRTKDGKGTQYALGLQVGERNGQPYLEHGGEVSGFVSEMLVLPRAKGAVAVLTNQDAVGAASVIARETAAVLEGRSPAEERALRIFREMQNGQPERKEFTEACNAYFDAEALADFAASLKPLGEPLSLVQENTQERGGMRLREFRLHFAGRDLTLTEYELPDGRLEQYLIAPRAR